MFIADVLVNNCIVHLCFLVFSLTWVFVWSLFSPSDFFVAMLPHSQLSATNLMSKMLSQPIEPMAKTAKLTQPNYKKADWSFKACNVNVACQTLTCHECDKMLDRKWAWEGVGGRGEGENIQSDKLCTVWVSHSLIRVPIWGPGLINELCISSQKDTDRMLKVTSSCIFITLSLAA